MTPHLDATMEQERNETRLTESLAAEGVKPAKPSKKETFPIDTRVNINLASARQIADALPGVGIVADEVVALTGEGIFRDVCGRGIAEHIHAQHRAIRVVEQACADLTVDGPPASELVFSQVADFPLTVLPGFRELVWGCSTRHNRWRQVRGGASIYATFFGRGECVIGGGTREPSFFLAVRKERSRHSLLLGDGGTAGSTSVFDAYVPLDGGIPCRLFYCLRATEPGAVLTTSSDGSPAPHGRTSGGGCRGVKRGDVMTSEGGIPQGSFFMPRPSRMDPSSIRCSDLPSVPSSFQWRAHQSLAWRRSGSSAPGRTE